MAGQNTSANDKQVGGNHYKKNGQMQHWDVVANMNWDYFQGNITKYVDRHSKKDGFKDLLKAQHYLEKYIEVTYPKELAAYRTKKISKSLDKKPAKLSHGLEFGTNLNDRKQLARLATELKIGPSNPTKALSTPHSLANRAAKRRSLRK